MAKKREKNPLVVAVTLKYRQKIGRTYFEAKRYTPEDAEFLGVLAGVRCYSELLDSGHAEIEYEKPPESPKEPQHPEAPKEPKEEK